ncbi:hypothetical protein IAR50_005902 [Cryptococcus sp. DSM 104548]
MSFEDSSSAESTPVRISSVKAQPSPFTLSRRPSTIAFDESCVLVDSDPLSMTDLEDGIKRQRMSVTGASERSISDKPRSPRLYFAIPPALRKALPSPRLRVLPSRWSASTPPYSTLTPTRSTPALSLSVQLGSAREPPKPVNSKSQPASPAISNPSIAEGLHMLSERDENTGHVSPSNPLSGGPLSPMSPTSPNAQRVWLCSPPRRCHTNPSATTAPPSSSAVAAPSHPPSTASTRKNRPVVVRAMSTGRLGKDFDQDGRIVCMSSHSNRVLQKTAVVTKEKEVQQHTQAARPKLRRAQTEKTAAHSHLPPPPVFASSMGTLPRRSSSSFNLATLQKERELARPNLLAKRVSSRIRGMSLGPERVMT